MKSNEWRLCQGIIFQSSHIFKKKTGRLSKWIALLCILIPIHLLTFLNSPSWKGVDQGKTHLIRQGFHLKTICRDLAAKRSMLFTELHKALMTQDWDNVADSLRSNSKHGVDPFFLFANELEQVQAYDPPTSPFVTRFDLIKPASYKAAMSSNQAGK